jgi:hypothetical protein
MKYFSSIFLIFILASCESSDSPEFPYDSRCIDFGGEYQIISMTSLGSPIDLDGDGISSNDLYSEITQSGFYNFEYRSSCAVVIPQNEYQKNNPSLWSTTPIIWFRIPVQKMSKLSDGRYITHTYQNWFNQYKYGFSNTGELWAEKLLENGSDFSEVTDAQYGEFLSIKKTVEDTFSAQFNVKYFDFCKNEFLIIPIDVCYTKIAN